MTLGLKPIRPATATRALFAGHVESLGALAPALTRAGEHFVLFLAADTRSAPGPALVQAAEAVIRAGASYVCCWGPDSARLHDAFDEADLAVNGESTDDRVVMTTWHTNEPIEEALWFAVHAAYPSAFYESTTRSVVAVAIANQTWARQIDAYLASGAPLPG